MRPADSLEQLPESLAALRVEMGDVGDAAFQVGAEMGMVVAVLVLWAMSNAIGEDGFEPVVLGPPHVWSGVEHNASHLLANALSHEMGLACIHLEAFFQGDAADLDLKATDAALQIFAAGENQVIRVACVGGTEHSRQAGQPAIQTVRTKVRQGRRGWRTLR